MTKIQQEEAEKFHSSHATALPNGKGKKQEM